MSIKERVINAYQALAGVSSSQVAPKTAQEKKVDALDFGDTPSTVDQVKGAFIEWTALWVPFLLAALLAISNGYFFSGFKDFSIQDVGVFVAWMSGFAIEAATLAAIFHAAQRLKHGKRKEFAFSLFWALVLASISFLAQYVFLQMEVARGQLSVNDAAIDKMPLFSLLVGTGGLQGHDVLFLVRTSAYHVAEFACTFLFTSKGVSVDAALRKAQDKFLFNTMSKIQDKVLTMMDAEVNGHQGVTVVEADQAPATVQQLPPPPPQVDLGELARLLAGVLQGQQQEQEQDSNDTQEIPKIHPLQPLLNARKAEQG